MECELLGVNSYERGSKVMSSPAFYTSYQFAYLFHSHNSVSGKFGLLSPSVGEYVQSVYDFSANLVSISIILSIYFFTVFFHCHMYIL